METENSLWYFRGKEARRNNEPMRSGYRLRGLNWAAWKKGWEMQDSEIAKAGRTPEVVAQCEEAHAFLAAELEKWKAEIAAEEEAQREAARAAAMPRIDGETAFFPAASLR